jgi:hypothetical protein
VADDKESASLVEADQGRVTKEYLRISAVLAQAAPGRSLAALKKALKATPPNLRDALEPLLFSVHAAAGRDTPPKPDKVTTGVTLTMGVLASLVAFGIVVWAFFLGDLTDDQRRILRWSLATAAGIAGGCFTGSITVKGEWQKLAVTATGGFGTWLVTFIAMAPPEVPQAALVCPPELQAPAPAQLPDGKPDGNVAAPKSGAKANEIDSKVPKVQFPR